MHANASVLCPGAVPAGALRLQGAVLLGEGLRQHPPSYSSSSASLNSSSSLRQKRRSTTKVRSSPEVKVRVTAKAKAAASRAATQTVGVAKRVMAYRAKVAAARADGGLGGVRTLVPQCGLSGCLSLRLLAGHVRLGRGGGEERLFRL